MNPLNELFWQNERELLFNILFPVVEDCVLSGAKNATDNLVSDLGIGVDWALVNDIAVDWSKRYTFELVKGITDTSQSFLQKVIPEWIESGKPLDELINDPALVNMFGKIRAEMIAVTEVTRSFAQGNMASWKGSGVVNGKEWMTAEDEIVCPICQPLSGDSVALNQNFEGGYDTPPAHPRCRCWISPVINV